jgi:hypothetical protein
MPLSSGALPTQPTFYATPFDRMNAFCDAQNRVANGDFDNINATIDLGGVVQFPSGVGLGSAAGRTDGVWIVNATVLDFANGDEFYRIHLIASNDVNFAPGNVDLLGFVDFAASPAGRLIATTMGASLPAPTRIFQPICNLRQNILYRYSKCRLVTGGTTPSITLTSWLSFARELM